MEIKELVALYGALILLCVAIMVGAFFLSGKECEAKTGSFKSSYFSVLAGCMVEFEDGRFIPLANYREV